ncbi:MAG TPA: universal stress protein [Solirubrobacteraceae bacterium]
MISTIAVGTDGSKTAETAVDAAFDLAEKLGARLVVVSAFSAKDHVVSTGAPLEEQWMTNPADTVHDTLHKAEERAAARGLTITTDAGEGDPADVLVRLAQKHDADVIVIGNKGMQRRVLGSVPNSVTHKAQCSVFVVKTT